MENKDYSLGGMLVSNDWKFNNVVSLGWFCGIAMSMKKNGFRSFSGPFDWYFSDLIGILQNIENDFSEFMLKENLQEVTENNLEFKDIKYGFHYNHEIKQNSTLQHSYFNIREKYKKRIVKFEDMVQTPTCFIRAIRNSEELQYIRKNYNEILALLKKYNDNNEIIYIISKEILGNFKDIPITIFQIEKYDGSSSDTLMRMFEQNVDICKWLNTRVNPKVISKNLLFENEKLLLEKSIYSSRYNLALSLLNFNSKRFSSEDYSKIIIYGAGKIGKLFYDKIEDKRSVLCFIDQNSSEEYKNVPIFRLGDLKSKDLIENNMEELMIIVTVGYDADIIIKEIKEIYSNYSITVITLLELLNKYKY